MVGATLLTQIALLIFAHQAMGSIHTPASVSLFEAKSDDGFLRGMIETSDATYHLALKKVTLRPTIMEEMIATEDGGFKLRDITVSEDLYHFEDQETGAVFYLNSDNKLEGRISDSQFLKYENDQHFVRDIEVKGKTCGLKSKGYHHVAEKLGLVGNAASEEETRTDIDFTVEMAVVLDTSICTLIGGDDANKQKYLAGFWKTIDSRFKTVEGATIRIVISKIILSKSITTDDKLLHYIEGSNKAYIDYKKTIVKVSTFAYTLDANTFDVLELMTAQNMANSKDGLIVDKSVAGYAYFATPCVRNDGKSIAYNTGISEDKGDYSGMNTVAHELAHTLGAPHDGFKTSTACSWTGGYLMSYTVKDYKTSRFSSCSSSSMIDVYQKPESSCLNTISNSATLIPFPDEYPGESSSFSAQCVTIVNKQEPTATNPRHKSTVSDDGHCYQLTCNYDLAPWIWTAYYGGALEGTPCPTTGGGCYNGKCGTKPTK